MWCRPIGEEEVGQTMGHRVWFLDASFHGLLKGLHKPLSCSIGGRMVWCTVDVFYTIAFEEDLELL